VLRQRKSRGCRVHKQILPDHHISEAAAQAEIVRRSGFINPTYPFTGKIKCGTCGNRFTRKKGTQKGKTYVHWICRSKKEVGMGCTSVNFGEGELKRISAQMLGMGEFDGAEFEKANRGHHGVPGWEP